MDQGFLFRAGIGFYALNAKSKLAMYAQKAMRMIKMYDQTYMFFML